MGLYYGKEAGASEGYLDPHFILAQGVTYNFVVGGRGTGKTTGMIDYIMEDPENRYFTWMRRLWLQAEMVASKDFSEFSKWSQLRGRDIYGELSHGVKNFGVIIDADVERVNHVPVSTYGNVVALSTMGNLRGVNFWKTKLLVEDEFIPSQTEKPVAHEFLAFCNTYETINRNRELEGEVPVKYVGLANAFDLANPLFRGFNLVSKAEKMQRKGQSVSIDKERGIAIYLLNDSEISFRKKMTALYRATQGTEYDEFALGNIFIDSKNPLIDSQKLHDFTPVATVAGICIYKHKSLPLYFVSRHISGGPDKYGDTSQEIRRFKLAYQGVYESYIRGRVKFESYDAMNAFLSMWEKKY